MTPMAKPLSEVTQEAISILLREIEVVDTVRFLNQFTGGLGNYTEEREQLYSELTLDEIVTAIEQDQKERPVK